MRFFIITNWDASYLMFWPEFFLVAAAVILSLIGVILTYVNDVVTSPAKATPISATPFWYLTLLVLIFYTFAIFINPHTPHIIYAGGLIQDKAVCDFRLIANAYLIGLVATSYGSLKSQGPRPALKYDFFVFLLFSIFGLNLVLVANTFLLLFLALEIYSLSAYLLLASRKNRPASLEVSFKYFVYSSFSSALLLFSVSLIYYRLGTIRFDDLHQFAAYYSQAVGDTDWVLILSLLLVLTAVAFKAGLAPFHLWAVDIYVGSTVWLFFYLLTYVKTFYIFLFVRLCSSFTAFSPYIGYYLIFVLISSLVIGTFAAIYHNRIKRVMIFSSVYNAGFFLATFMVQPTFSASFGFIFFSSTYLLSMLGLAAVFLGLFDKITGVYVKKVEELASVRTSNIALVFVFALLTLSLAGIPPMSVFYGKLLVWYYLVAAGYVSMCVVLVVMSVVALFYYIRLIRISASYRISRPSHLLELTGWGSVPLIGCALMNLSCIFFIGDWAVRLSGVLG